MKILWKKKREKNGSHMCCESQRWMELVNCVKCVWNRLTSSKIFSQDLLNEWSGWAPKRSFTTLKAIKTDFFLINHADFRSNFNGNEPEFLGAFWDFMPFFCSIAQTHFPKTGECSRNTIMELSSSRAVWSWIWNELVSTGKS